MFSGITTSHFMKCSEVRTFLSQINDRQESIDPIPSADLDYLSANGYVLTTTKDDYDKEVNAVAQLSQLSSQMDAEKAEEEQANTVLQQDEQKEHSFLFHLEGDEKREEISQRIQTETATVSKEQAELSTMEASVNELIQKKSTIDQMVPYNGEYLSLTGLGTIILNDLNVRNYRVADEEFADFVTEIKAVSAELRSIADKASSYVNLLKPRFAQLVAADSSNDGGQAIAGWSLLWSVAIGLAKLQGDSNQIGERFVEALNILSNFKSTTPNKLMAAEIMTSISSQDIQSLESVLKDLDQQLRNQGVPKELSAGVAATIMAGRRFDGTYPVDRFIQFKQRTSSDEAAAILAVMNVEWNELADQFQSFRALFASWGYMASDDTEIASAFLAIGELKENEIEDKLKYIVEQLKNYLEYPLVAAAILASIPVFEAHEVLDLMEKAVTLLSGYTTGFERSELVALAVRMIHGVRNELVKEIDPTAKVTESPVQFTYGARPGFFIWYYPIIVAHSSYHATFSGMGGFHPAHSHGIGGFAG
jgi:hypothetical protein